MAVVLCKVAEIATAYGDVPRGKPIRLATPGLHVQYTHAELIFYPWVFVPKIITSPGTERTTSLSTA